jgi:hypothetical protein
MRGAEEWNCSKRIDAIENDSKKNLITRVNRRIDTGHGKQQDENATRDWSHKSEVATVTKEDE